MTIEQVLQAIKDMSEDELNDAAYEAKQKHKEAAREEGRPNYWSTFNRWAVMDKLVHIHYRLKQGDKQ